LTLSLSNCNT